MRRALLVGGSGQLGTEIRRNWSDWTLSAPSHADLDLEDTGAIAAALERHAPDAVVNCSAFHNVDQCELEPERALAVNALAVGRAARLCGGRGARFVTVSSDYVFDGRATRPYREDDPVHPISAYGVSKVAGELLVEALGSDALVVRTCGVYGVRPSASKGYTFVDRVIAQGRSARPATHRRRRARVAHLRRPPRGCAARAAGSRRVRTLPRRQRRTGQLVRFCVRGARASRRRGDRGTDLRRPVEDAGAPPGLLGARER